MKLKNRGHSDADVRGLEVQTIKEQDRFVDHQLASIGFLFFIAVVAVVTFCLFAPILYYSVVVYGLPASVFITVGYYVWLALLRRGSRRATAFALSFALPVLILLIAQSTATPKYVALIFLEFCCFGLLLKVVIMKRKAAG